MAYASKANAGDQVMGFGFAICSANRLIETSVGFARVRTILSEATGASEKVQQCILWSSRKKPGLLFPVFALMKYFVTRFSFQLFPLSVSKEFWRTMSGRFGVQTISFAGNQVWWLGSHWCSSFLAFWMAFSGFEGLSTYLPHFSVF